MSSVYIGFDFDGCMAECYSLMPIIFLLEVLIPEELNKLVGREYIELKAAFKKCTADFYANVAINEVKTGGTLIRPSLLKVLPELLKERRENKIGNLFIYSNNQDSKLIDIVDHILALALVNLSSPVPEKDLVKDADTGRLQVFEPRVHRNAGCRSSEKILGFSYKEKTVKGIQVCLNKSINESELWFLDDTRDHTDLVNRLGLGKRYIETSKYEIKLKNLKIAEIFVRSFSKDCFDIAKPMGTVFLRAYSALEGIFVKTDSDKSGSRFNPLATDTDKKVIERLTYSMRIISPKASGRSKEKWTDKETQRDTDKLQKSLSMKFNQPKHLNPPADMAETATAYGQTMEGGRYRNRGSVTRRMRRKVHEAK